MTSLSNEKAFEPLTNLYYELSYMQDNYFEIRGITH